MKLFSSKCLLFLLFLLFLHFRRAAISQLCLFWFTFSVAGAEIYISPSGSDGNDGSRNNPLRSLRAAHDLAKPGDTIIARPGDYDAGGSYSKAVAIKRVEEFPEAGPAVFNSDFINSCLVHAGPDLFGFIGKPVQLQGRVNCGGAIHWEWEPEAKPRKQVHRDPSWTVVNPKLTFSEAGTFKIWIVHDENGQRDQTTITIRERPDPTCSLKIAGYSGIPLTLKEGKAEVHLRANFTANGSKNPFGTKYSWSIRPDNLGSGTTIAEPMGESTLVIFRAPGDYILKVIASYGNCTEEAEVKLKVKPTPIGRPIKISLTASPQSPISLPGPENGVILDAFPEEYTTDQLNWAWKVDPNASVITISKGRTRLKFDRPDTYRICVTAKHAGDNREGEGCMTYTVIPPPESYIRTSYRTVNSCCAKQGAIIKNEHPSCPIRVKLIGSNGIGCPPGPDPVYGPVTLSPGETFDIICTSGIKKVEASFTCSLSQLEHPVSAALVISGMEINELSSHHNMILSAPPNQAYWLESSEDLVNWVKLKTVESAEGSAWLTDELANATGNRFYRTVLIQAEDDADADGLSDLLELTYPNAFDPAVKQVAEADFDGDGVNDFAEVNIFNTEPEKSDTDGDGLLDGEEISSGTNPLDRMSK